MHMLLPHPIFVVYRIFFTCIIYIQDCLRKLEYIVIKFFIFCNAIKKTKMSCILDSLQIN